MFKRPPFWLGLLLGIGAAFGVRLRLLPALSSPASDPLLDFVSDAVLICDASGAISYANAAARRLFGADGKDSFPLCYPSGQPVPPGQIPLFRALQTRQTVTGAGYVLTAIDGQRRIFDVAAYPHLNGAVAVFQDVTARQEIQARQAETEKRGQTLRSLALILSATKDREGFARCIVDSALTLLDRLPDAQVRLHIYDSESKQITRLASAPEDRPKRPKTLKQAQPPTFPFDAQDPLLWQVYVARQPFVTSESVCALPLLAGGKARGHLSATCSAADAFAEAGVLDALRHLTALAALALMGSAMMPAGRASS